MFCVFVRYKFKTLNRKRVRSVLQQRRSLLTEQRTPLGSSINLQVRVSISVGVGNAVLRNVTVFCRRQAITAKYL